MSDTLLRQWTLLRLIPRSPQKADGRQLLRGLAGRRLLHHAPSAAARPEHPVERVSARGRRANDPLRLVLESGCTRVRPTRNGRLDRVDRSKLVEQFIPQLLPPNLTDHLQPYFHRADAVLAETRGTEPRHWLDRVRVVPREMPLLAPERRRHRRPAPSIRACSTAGASPPSTPHAPHPPGAERTRREPPRSRRPRQPALPGLHALGLHRRPPAGDAPYPHRHTDRHPSDAAHPTST